MKSKKVREFIDGHIAINQRSFTAADIEYCAALAEDDRDAKAVEAHRVCCHELRTDDGCHAKFDKWDIYSPYLPKCNYECKYMNDFIQKLNED